MNFKQSVAVVNSAELHSKTSPCRWRAKQILQQTITLILSLPFLFFAILPNWSCTSADSKPDAYYDTLFKKLLVSFDRGAKDSSVAIADSFYRATGNPSGYFKYKYHNFLALYCYQKERIDESRMHLDTIIQVLENYHLTHKYPLAYANVLNARGNYYFNGNDPDKAFEFYSKSRIAAKEGGSSLCGFWDLSYRLGMVTYRQEKYEEAAGYFKESLVETANCPPDSQIYFKQQELLNNIALAYTHLNQYDSAAMYYLQALDTINIKGKNYAYSRRIANMSVMATGVVYGNLAKIYIARDMPDTAEKLLLQSIAINIQPGGDNRDAMFAQMQLAELYFKTYKFPQLSNMLGEVNTSLHKTQESSIGLRWRHLMYEYNKAINKPLISLAYLEDYLHLKDSTDAANKALKKTDYGRLFKDKDTEYQLNLLKKDNELNRLYLILTIGLSVISALIIVMVLNNYRKSKKNVNTLTLLNHQISDQKIKLEQTRDALYTSNQDKDRILHVVAHDLRSPISGIMMLSQLIKEEENDTSKNESLEMITNASQSLLSLTAELLEFSEDQQNETPAEKEAIDVCELAGQVTGLLQFKATAYLL